jgi:hemerythrin
VVEHFKTEERMMEGKCFGGLGKHRQEHENLVSTCADLQKKFHANEAGVEEESMSFLKNSLNQHIPVTGRSNSPALNG